MKATKHIKADWLKSLMDMNFHATAGDNPIVVGDKLLKLLSYLDLRNEKHQAVMIGWMRIIQRMVPPNIRNLYDIETLRRALDLDYQEHDISSLPGELAGPSQGGG